ncbi:MAG: sulfotransferase family protein [Solirubrobacteraceae bacterium]
MAAAAETFDTIIDPWRPRDEEWLQRGPSKYAGRPKRPVLIGACPRSGTTLLRGILDNHPDLAVVGETNFIFWIVRHRADWGNLKKEANRRKLAEWLFDGEGRGQKRVQGGTPRDEAVQRMVDGGTSLGSMFDAIFQMYADRHGKARWGDKRPGYAGFIELMFELYPDAQFVNLVRDPRGAVASQLPLGWDKPGTELASSFATWETSIQRVDAFAPKLRPDQLIDVRFEDLVRDPLGEIRKVCEWATLSADEETVARMVTGKRRGSFREGWHDRLNDEIDTTPIDNWRARMKPAQLAFVQQVGAEHFARLGYQPVDVEAEPRKKDLRELERQRARRAAKWERRKQEERRNRLKTLWRPIAAQR